MKYYLIDTLQTVIYNVCGLFYKLKFFKNFMKYFRNVSLKFSRKQNFMKFYISNCWWEYRSLPMQLWIQIFLLGAACS